MQSFLVITLSIFFPIWVLAEEPIKFKITAEYKQFVPVFVAASKQQSEGSEKSEVKQSPFGSKSIVVIEESDLTKVPYDQSFAKLIVLEQNEPSVSIELKKYKSFEYEWLNEELVHVAIWPGRCVSIDVIYDLSLKESIYTTGFQHCGVRK